MKHSAAELFSLYASDRLVLHSIPLPKLPERPAILKDASSITCGSLLFYNGLKHQCTGNRLPTAVARFGDKERVIQTVFGTLHDLDLIWQTQEELEAQKKEPKQSFLFFTDCDMAEAARQKGGDPFGSFLDTEFGVTEPVVFQRTRDFDFRAHCEHAMVRDDPEKPCTECEWNELRAALSVKNMVGLCYIYDPTHSPSDHRDAARQLAEAFGPDLVCAVFELSGPGKVDGQLLVTEEGEGGGKRLVTFEEFLQRSHKDSGSTQQQPEASASA